MTSTERPHLCATCRHRRWVEFSGDHCLATRRNYTGDPCDDYYPTLRARKRLALPEDSTRCRAWAPGPPEPRELPRRPWWARLWAWLGGTTPKEDSDA